MAVDQELQDQQHPQENRDRLTVEQLLKGEPKELHFAELARLRIRYQGFPGARDIQRDLDRILAQWQMSEAELFAKTREIHEKGLIYRKRGAGEQDDWS